jgi:hypothetical protein
MVVLLTTSAMLMAAQVQMPANGKSDAGSPRPKTFTGIVSDSMCGAKHMAKD